MNKVCTLNALILCPALVIALVVLLVVLVPLVPVVPSVLHTVLSLQVSTCTVEALVATACCWVRDLNLVVCGSNVATTSFARVPFLANASADFVPAASGIDIRHTNLSVDPTTLALLHDVPVDPGTLVFMVLSKGFKAPVLICVAKPAELGSSNFTSVALVSWRIVTRSPSFFSRLKSCRLKSPAGCLITFWACFLASLVQNASVLFLSIQF